MASSDRHVTLASSPETHLLSPNPNTKPTNLTSTPLGISCLILISHSHSPPLNPPPDLKFDVRSLPNPPKNVRDKYNGTSKRLREWMVNEADFVERVAIIREVIEGRMRESDVKVVMMNEKDDESDLGKGKEEERSEVDDERTLLLNSQERDCQESENEEGGTALPNDRIFEEEKEDEDEDEEEEEEAGPILRVGIFCEMGRHRSVAMVEELARLGWPGWEVEVVHRDVDRKRGSVKNERRKHGRGRMEGVWPG